MIKRFISLALTLALCLGLFIVVAPSASAAYVYNPAPSSGSAFANELMSALGGFFNMDLSLNSWDFTFTAHGFVTEPQLDEQKENYNSFVSRLVRQLGNAAGYKHFFSTAVKAYDSDNGIWRLADSATGKWIVDSMGRFPYYESVVAGGGKGLKELSDVVNPAPEINKLYGNQWIQETKLPDALVNINPGYSYDELTAHADLLESMPSRSSTVHYKAAPYKQTGYYGLRRVITSSFGSLGNEWLCDKNGAPFLTTKDKYQLAVNQKVNNIVQDGNGNAVAVQGTTVTTNEPLVSNDDNSVNMPILFDTDIDSIFKLNIEDMTYNFDDRSYTLNAYDITYNNDNRRYETNYYTYNVTYNITNTYVTYIGSNDGYQPHEYTFYYELPDGRSSADLTADEVAALSFQFYDCLNYERAATDVNMRALYHFDGDLADSSFFSDASSFTWEAGGSVTYMDSSTFNGALYLDERAHKFNISLPSRIASGADFTIQFRHYQASQPDTQDNIENGLYLGGVKLLAWDERNLYGPSNAVFCQLPIGNWSELAVIRSNGVIYAYVNGVKVGSYSNSAAFSKTLSFALGNTSRAYTMLDELRVVDFAIVQGGANYTPTSVPYDSNLVLVLPGEGEVAAEWFEFDDDNELISNADFTADGFALGVDDPVTPPVGQWMFKTSSGYSPSAVYLEDGYLSLYNGSSGSNTWLDAYGGSGASAQGFFCVVADSTHGSSRALSGFSGCFTHNVGSSGSTYSFFVVLQDGTLCTMTFNPYASNAYKEFSWGRLVYKFSSSSVGRTAALFVVPAPGQTVDIVYAGVATSPDPFADWNYTKHSGKVDGSSLQANTAAVQTDIPITGYTVGGVRPTFPQRGNVWFGVTSGRVSSVQIYTGSAWENANARWWTGSRWIPIYAFDIFTLQDCWDVADADDVITPIASETQGWNWWKGAWYDFRSWLKDLFGGGISTPEPSPSPSSEPVTSTFTVYATEQDNHPALTARIAELTAAGKDVSLNQCVSWNEWKDGIDKSWGRDLTAKMGTSNYFNVHYGPYSKVDRFQASFPDGWFAGHGSGSTRFNLNRNIGNSQCNNLDPCAYSIEFTTLNPATVKVWGTGNDCNLYDASLNLLDFGYFYDPSTTSSGQQGVGNICTFDLSAPGTFYLNVCSGSYIYKVEVVEDGLHAMESDSSGDPTEIYDTYSHTLLGSHQATNAVLLNRIADLVDSGKQADLRYNASSGDGYVSWGYGVSAKMGTADYFTVNYSDASKVDYSGGKEWSDGFSVGADFARFNFGGSCSSLYSDMSNSITFLPQGMATVSIWWVPGGDGRQLCLRDVDGQLICSTDSSLAKKNEPIISTLALDKPGFVKLGSLSNNSYIFKVVVTELRPRSTTVVTVGTNPGDHYDDGTPDILDDPLQDEDGENVSIFSLIGLLGKGMWSLTKGLFGTALGGVAGFFKAVTGGVGGFFGTFDAGPLGLKENVFGFYNYTGVDIWE